MSAPAAHVSSIWHPHLETTDPTCTASTLQVGGRGCQTVRNVFLAKPGPLESNQSECQRVKADFPGHAHSFIDITFFHTVYFHNHNTPCN